MYEFSRKYRLASKQDIQSVFAKPSKFSRKYLLVLARANQKDHARVAIIINKNYVKLTVDRNSIRRVIRDSFRHTKDQLKGLDIIVLIRSECTPLDKKALRDDIAYLWQQLINSLKQV